MTIHRGWSKYAPNKSKMTDGRHFGKLLNCHIYATIRWILMKFGMVTDTGHPGTMMQMGLLTVLTSKKMWISKIQDGKQPSFWKPLNRHISTTVWPILLKFGMLMHIRALQRTVEISNFWKFKTAAANCTSQQRFDWASQNLAQWCITGSVRPSTPFSADTDTPIFLLSIEYDTDTIPIFW